MRDHIHFEQNIHQSRGHHDIARVSYQTSKTARLKAEQAERARQSRAAQASTAGQLLKAHWRSLSQVAQRVRAALSRVARS